MTHTSIDRKSIHSAASQNGLRLGLLWLASFGCTMYAMDFPLLGTVGNFAALFSIVACTRMIRTFRASEYNLNWLQSLWFSMTSFFYAALLTTMGQYIYFAFIDNGHFMGMVTELLNEPANVETMKQNFPGLNTENVLEVIGSMSTREIIIQLLLMNGMATVPCSVLSAIFGGFGKVTPRPEPQS